MIEKFPRDYFNYHQDEKIGFLQEQSVIYLTYK